MACTQDQIIYIGSDEKSVQIDFTNIDGTESDLSGFNILELHLVDEYDIVQAKYIRPFADQQGYHELRLPFESIVEFDIHKEDSINFRAGDLYANVTLEVDDIDFPDGNAQMVNHIFVATMKP